MTTVTVLLSGGLDSTCLAALLVRAGHDVHGLAVDYGQAHAVELDHARRVAAALGITYREVRLPALAALLPGSALTSGAPYASPIVANRNAILTSLAVGYASARGHTAVALAVHADDGRLFPDCRPAYVAAMAALARHAGVELRAPFVDRDRLDLVAAGVAAGAPVHLTRSCYTGRPAPCHQCLACTERDKALSAVPR